MFKDIRGIIEYKKDNYLTKKELKNLIEEMDPTQGPFLLIEEKYNLSVILTNTPIEA